jgi:hypothetical protein
MSIAHKDPKLPLSPEIPEGPEWTRALTVLSPEVGETLVAVVRTLCPHDVLADRVYRRVVLHYDRLARTLPATAASIEQAVCALDGAIPLPFRERSESYRIAALKAIETTTAFVFLQRTAVRFLYDDVEVWEAFGYEGASVHLGGYVTRGFADLDWLPEPPIGGAAA